MRKIMLFAAAVLTVFASCGGGRKAKAAADTPEGAGLQKTYVMPAIPSMMTDPEEQARYLAQHFWDSFDFTDTTDIGNADYTEQAFTNYVQILLNIPHDIGDASIRTMFRKAAADKDMFQHFAELSEKYLFDPNSPFRDDEYYITVLQSVLENPALDEWERIRPQEQLRMALKNRVGTPAADFRYTLESGATGTLYGLKKAPYTLVFINNPGCTACKETMQQILGSQLLTQLMTEGMIAVLAIYPDEDLEEWRKFAPHMPAGWINSYDRELKIKNDELYDLKAIPTLYLLDADKVVMLKDVMSIPLIEETIYNDLQL